MKIIYLAAVAAVVGLTGCEKTEVNPPATVVTPAPTAAPAPEVVPVPVPVQGPAGPAGEKGEKGDAGSTTVVVPEPAPAPPTK